MGWGDFNFRENAVTTCLSSPFHELQNRPTYKGGVNCEVISQGDKCPILLGMLNTTVLLTSLRSW